MCQTYLQRNITAHLAPPALFRHTARPMKKKSSRSKNQNSMRPFSSILVDGPERAAARAMLYPVGFTDEDFKKPIIGIASTWSNVTPCNMHIDKLALEAEKGANAGGGKAIVFNTITISDGIRSEEHTSELQSLRHLVCRLL